MPLTGVHPKTLNFEFTLSAFSLSLSIQPVGWSRHGGTECSIHKDLIYGWTL